MSDSSQFSFPRFRRAEKFKSAELDIFFELCPTPVLLINNRDSHIQRSNRPAQKFLGYAEEELESLFIQDILSNDNNFSISDRITNTNPVDYGHTEFICKNQTSRKATVQTWQISGGKGLTLLVLKSDGWFADGLSEKDYWESFSRLLTVVGDERNVDPINKLLDSALEYSGITSFAVYLAESTQLELRCVAQSGDTSWLPETIPAQDFVNLPKSRRWVFGKRPFSAATRAAHAEKITYVISLPLNLEKKFVGVIILADPDNEPSMHMGQTLSKLINLSIQKSEHADDIKILSDITSHLQSLDSILKEAILEGIIILSPDFQIIEINLAAEKILGYNRRQAYRQPVEKILIGTDTLQQALEEIQRTNTLKNPVDVRIYRRSGEAFLARLNVQPVYSHGNLTNIILLFQDRSKEESVQEQTRQLEQRAILGEILAVFAHEVRNPINNISTGLELISMNLPAADANQETISRLLQDCDRLAELMKSVLAYSKPTEYTFRLMSLEPFLQNILERNRSRMERAGIYGSLHVEMGLPSIMGNSRALEQVFTNLINNALQAIGSNGGQIVIRVQRPIANQDEPVISHRTTQGIDTERFIEISIVDTGPGISQEQLEKIFKPFYTTNFSGTGLGLAIAKRIITAHRGYIDVTSFPGGTVFKVYLPIHETIHNDRSLTPGK